MHYWAEARKKSLALVDNHEAKKKLWCVCLCVCVAEDREEEKSFKYGISEVLNIFLYEDFPDQLP